jgi:5'-3' exonuclease
MGDEADGVPGIQHLAPGFGRKTAVKLLNKHGSLENLLKTAAIRTVGKEYAQEVLVKHADYLRKNYEVLSLRRYEFTDILNALNFHLLLSMPWKYINDLCTVESM